jgi:general secretion pathway protein I
MSTRPRQHGFSVIEALVAVAVVAIALSALVTLQIQVSRTFAEQRTMRAQISAERNALELLRDMNIAERPTGVFELGPGQQVRWDAIPISRPARTTNLGSGFGSYELVLYRVRLVVTQTANSRPVSLTVDKIGWRPAGPVNHPE